ncbi:MAG: phosphoribosyltransferase family protein [Rhodocyclaceae bacterium]
MLFADRLDAGRRLAKALEAYDGCNPLVLAIPRGAVPMGAEIARRLHGELDVVLVRKLGAPGNPEFAIGAIDESGWVYLSPWARSAGLTDEYLERVERQELETLRQRRARFSPLRPARDPAGRVVIVVDDGLATGATMIAALHCVRGAGPQKLVCAVPVASLDALGAVRGHCDEVVCLHTPADFYAVGQFYGDFAQVEDDEVVRLLSKA